jgi:hypothetical protein
MKRLFRTFGDVPGIGTWQGCLVRSVMLGAITGLVLWTQFFLAAAVAPASGPAADIARGLVVPLGMLWGTLWFGCVAFAIASLLLAMRRPAPASRGSRAHSR